MKTATPRPMHEAPTMVETSGGIRFYQPIAQQKTVRPPAPASIRAPRRR